MAAKEEYYAPVNGGIVELAGGASVPPGSTIKLTEKEAEDPHNAELIKTGTLIKLKGGGK